jgi:hypothetical protein
MVYALSPPLQGVHWDAPIYTYKGKLAAEAGLIGDLASNSERIGERYRWEPFWDFFRIGNVAIVGSVIAAFGASVEAIRAVHMLYALMMYGILAASFFLVIFLCELLRVRRDSRRLSIGILISLLLYSLSDVSPYLARSLVSEVPALLAVTAGALFLVLSQARRSIPLAIAAGLFAFFAHVVRYETIWLPVAFAISLVLLQWMMARDRLWITGYAVGVITSLIAFLAYSAVFFPMTDPRFFLEFLRAHESQGGASDLVHSLLSAGGLLWIGVFFGIVLRQRGKALRLSGILLLFALLPYLPFFFSGGAIQTRILVPLLFLPLLVGSSMGWTSLLELGSGGARGAPVVVVPGAHYGTLFLLRFFGDRYYPADDFAMTSNPVYAQLNHCGPGFAHREWERVLTCRPNKKDSLASVRVPGRSVQLLYDKIATQWAESSGVCLDNLGTPLFETARYAVVPCEAPPAAAAGGNREMPRTQ